MRIHKMNVTNAREEVGAVRALLLSLVHDPAVEYLDIEVQVIKANRWDKSYEKRIGLRRRKEPVRR